VLKGNTSQLPIGTVWVDLPFAIQVNRARNYSQTIYWVIRVTLNGTVCCLFCPGGEEIGDCARARVGRVRTQGCDARECPQAPRVYTARELLSFCTPISPTLRIPTSIPAAHVCRCVVHAENEMLLREAATALEARRDERAEVGQCRTPLLLNVRTCTRSLPHSRLSWCAFVFRSAASKGC
jgi:hypothetical protein